MTKKWRVYPTPGAERILRLDIEAGRIDADDIKIILNWVREIEEFGPLHLKRSKIWNDHPLEGDWWGCRSSSFSFRGRIIYRIIDERVIVEIVRITADHDYTKR